MLPRSTTVSRAPIIFSASKIVAATIHLLIGPTVWYILKHNLGSQVVLFVGDKLLGLQEETISTHAVQGDRLAFFSLLSLLYGLRWTIGSFTLNGGGPLPMDVAISVGILHLVEHVVPFTILSVMGHGLPSDLTIVDYVAGCISIFAGVLQHVSEVQRFLFKRDPKNKGKIHTGGLFRYARYINHTGFVLYEVSTVMASRSFFVWIGYLLYAFQFVFFQLVPELDVHMREKYNKQYEKYAEQTPYLLIPYVY